MKRLARVVAYQELSISTEATSPFPIPLDAEYPKAILRPLHESETEQRNFGGTYVVVDFEPREQDILRIAYEGSLIAADLLTTISLTTGIQFKETAIIEATGPANEGGERSLAHFVEFEERRWPRTVPSGAILRARAIAAHWARAGAKRLRRAAHAYAQALGLSDPVEAFVWAYSGLEALDPPLAREAKLDPGAEVVEGQCKACKATYTYKRTVLVGVRAFILARTDDKLGPEEWKDLSRLRHAIVHGLEDQDAVRGEAERLLPAVLHHLHDALMHLTHQHDQENQPYQIPRMIDPVIMAPFLEDLPPLEDWRTPVFEIRDLKWVPHEKHGHVPEFNAFNTGHDVGAIEMGYLKRRLGEATKADIERLELERGGGPEPAPSE